MLMAVAETACSTGTGRAAASPAGGTAKTNSGATRIGIPAIQLAVWACMGLPMVAGAQIVADPSAGANRPGVIQTANGLPQVNITRPSSAGVSVNHYTQFDVNRPGAILNNSPVITTTQQAGYINGNPNLLPGGSARIIVNQVNSTSPSQLRGYLEVAGGRADVVIANPNGLLVDGAGFINTSRVTLTTGTPVYGGSGSLDAFRVTGGQISVEGAGLNAASTDQVDLIARAVKANAAIYANRLNVVAGANQVDYNALSASAIAGNGPAPAVGIDVSELGGMYANKILLASTELGVGVSNRGVLAAQAGELTLTAQGKLVLAGQTNTTGNLAVSARDGIDNGGTTYSAGAASLRTDGTFSNGGTLAAQQSLGIHAQSVASTGTLAAGLNPDGTSGPAADLTVSATGAVSATGRNLASGNATIQGASVSLAGSQTATNGNLGLTASAGNLDLTGATAAAGAALVVNAQGALVNDRGQMSSGTATSLSAGSLSNQGGQIVSQGATTIQSAGAVNNMQGTVQAGGALMATAASVDNTAGRMVSLNADGLSIQTAGMLVNTAGTTASGAQGGVIGGNGNLRLTAGGLINHGQVNAQGDATVHAASLNNDTGTLSAGGALTATATGGMSSRQGVVSGSSVAVAAQSLDNTAGQIEGGQLAIQATGDLINQGGSLKQYGQADTSITAGGKLDNTGGTIAANGQNLTVNAGSLTNDGGQVSHAGAGTLAMASQGPVINAGGVIQTNGALTAQLGSLDGAGGTVSAQKALALTVQGAVDNTSATLHAGDGLTLQAAGALTNAGGRIESASADGALSVSAASVDNTGGRIANAGDGLTQVTARQQILNAPGATSAAGLIGGNGALALNAGTSIVNQGVISARDDATLNAQTIANDTGSLTAGGVLSLASTGTTSNRGGFISAATTTLGAASLDNTDGWLDGDSVNVTTAGDLSNRGGTIKQYGQNDTIVTAGAKLDNTGGIIAANGANLTIGAGTLVNDSGSVAHAGTGTLAVASQGTLSNAAGAIQTNGSLQAQATTLDNSQGTITAQGTATAITSGNLGNRQGSIYGQTGLTLASGGTVDNTAGSAQTAGNLAAVATGAVVNQGGKLAANGLHGEVNISATSVDNTRGLLVNAGDGVTTVTATNAFTNTAGKLGGNGDVTIGAQALANNTDGAAGGLVAAGGALALNITSQLDNRGGTLYGQGLTLNQAGATFNNAGGQVLGSTDVKLNVASLSNLGGAVKANQDVVVGGAVSGSGTMIAGRDLTLNVAGDYTNDASNLLRANRDMRVAASGTLANTATLAAAGALTVSGANVANAAGADINSANTTVTASNIVSNAGRIEGDAVQIGSPTVVNTGTVIGNNVQAQGTDIVNNGAAALMAAVQNLKLYATNSVQNLEGATLYSAGNLQIARDGTRDSNTGLLANQVNTLINRSANIEADGDIDIAANQVSNTRTSIVTTPGTPVQTAVQTLTLWQAGLIDIDLNSHSSVTFPGWNWSAQNAQISTPQTNALRAPVTVTVDKSTVTSLNTTSQTLSFTQSPIEEYNGMPTGANCDPSTLICTRPLTVNPTQYYQSITDNGTTYSITFWPDWDPNVNIRPDLVRQANFGHDYNEISRTTVTMTATDQLVSATDPAKIQAGGSIRINSNGGNILNQSSTMAAGGNLVRVAANGGVQDVGTVLQQTVTTEDTSTFYWHQRTGGSQDIQVVALPGEPQAPTTVMALPAIATANQTVQTTAQNVTVASVNAVGAAVTGSSVTGGGASGTQLAGVSGSAGGAAAVSAGGASAVTGVTGQVRPAQTLGTASGGIPNLKLPTNGLYTIRTTPGDTYLVATDPHFTQYTNFISSDYMLNALGLDPQKTQKRLGDGFYEEKLIRDQVTQLTGRTFLAGYTDQLEEYKALMNNGVTYAKTFNLTPGVGLTDEQMRQLTTDMVWMVSQDVTLPDGTTQSVLVPKVYLAQGNGVDLQSTGALVAGNAVSINAAGSVENSGTIVGDIATQVVGTDIVNRGSIGGTGTTVVSATQDVRNLGGRIGGQDVVVAAGRDVVNESQTITNTTVLANGNSASATGIGAVASISGTNNVAVMAGRDLTSTGATLSAGNDLALGAGRDMRFGTVATGTTQDATAHGGQDYLHDQTVVNQGSTIQAGQSVTAVAGRDMTLTNTNVQSGTNAALVAGQNVAIVNATDAHTHSEAAQSNRQQSSYTQSSYDETVQGSNVQAGRNVSIGAGQSTLAATVLAANGITAASTTGSGSVAITGSAVSAGNDGKGGGRLAVVATDGVTVSEAREVHDAASESRTRSGGFLSRSSTHDQSSSHEDLGVGSTLAGDSVGLKANNDVTIRQSAVIGSDAVNLQSTQGNVLITAGQNVRESSVSHEESKSGVSAFAGAGGIGVSVGSSSGSASGHVLAVTQSDARSTVGATDGNVTILAGQDATVIGSDVIAGRKDGNEDVGHIDILAKNVTIAEGIDRIARESSASSRSSGLSVALVGTPLDTANNLRDAQQNPSGVTRAKQTLSELGAAAGTTPQVAISFSNSKSSSQSSSVATISSGSSLSGAGDVRVRATGNGETDADGRALDGNILVSGSTISAGQAAVLDAARDVTLRASTDTYTESNSATSSGWKISTATPSLGDIGRHIEGGPNNSGVSMVPYGSQRADASGDLASSQQNASVITGNTVGVKARTGDITIAGSGIAGESDVTLSAAKGKIDILSGQDTLSQRSDSSSRQIGDLGGTGYAGTVGVRSESHHTDTNQATQNTIRSQVVSDTGNVAMVAGDDITARGADIAAGNDVTMIGKNVILDPGTDSASQNESHRVSQYGSTLALSGYTVQAAQAVENAARAVEDGKDDRVAALYGVQAGLALANGIQGVQTVTSGGTSPTAAVKVTASIGGGSQSSESHMQASTNQGTTVKAGNAVTVIATGSGSGQKDAEGYSTDGDISGRGVQIEGKTVTLSAARDVNLESAQDRSSLDNRSSGSNASIGVGFGLGGDQNGFTLELAASQNKAKANGEAVTNHNAHVVGTDKVTVVSGRDASLKGAQLIGDTVEGTAGRDLNIESRPDTETYHSKESSSGVQASICVPPFCYGTTVHASGSVTQGNTDSTYSSVQEQSGIYAGQGGFNVDVKGNTDLKGGILASTADLANNHFKTGTLTTSDIENKAEYSSDSTTFVASYSGGKSVQASDPNLGPVQQAHVDWAGNANLLQSGANSLAATAAGNAQKPIDGNAAGVTKSAIAAGSVEITDSAGQQAKTGKSADETVASLNRDTANANQSIDKIFDAQKVKDQRELNQLQSQVAQQLAPMVYDQVGMLTRDQPPEVKVAVHTVIGGLLAQAMGGSFAAGAAGDAVATAAAELVGQQILNNPDLQTLSEQDRKALVQIAGTIVAAGAGAAVGGTIQDAAAAGAAGGLGTQYNYLNHTQKKERAEATTACKDADCKKQVQAKYAAEWEKNRASVENCSSQSECLSVAQGLREEQQAQGQRMAELQAKGPLNWTEAESLEYTDLRFGDASLNRMRSVAIGNANRLAGNDPLDVKAVADLVADIGIGAASGFGVTTGKYSPNVGAVGNMKQYLSSDGFGSELSESVRKTSQQYQGQSIYKATSDIGENISRGDQLYLDGLHKDHIEVFDRNGKFKASLNLDGTINEAKTTSGQGRVIK